MAEPDVALASGSSGTFRRVDDFERCSIDWIKRRHYRLWRHLKQFAGAARQRTLPTDKRDAQRRVFNFGRAKAAPLQALGKLNLS